MFSSQKQQCRAIICLLQSLGLGHIWTDEGPSRLACEWLEGNPLSSGEDLMLRIAFDFWNGMGKASFAKVVKVLDNRRTQDVADLLRAVTLGGDAVEAWIKRQENRAPDKSPHEMSDSELLDSMGFDPKKWKVQR